MKMTHRARNPISITILLFVIVILAVFIIDPNLLSCRVPGSFEYVRKGEALSDKGEYRGAIKYFERAHAASPENDVIRNRLVYAYSSFAVKLAESEKYEEAIGYLSKAYDLVRNAYTTQNLALMYARKALAEAKKSDWIKAREDLDMAREAAGDSAFAGRGLGISLFNDAVAEFKAAREDIAILLLKAAVLAYGDSRIYEFLGDVYYKKTELEKASFYFDKAAKLDPENEKLTEKREKVIKEEALSRDEETRSLPHFDVNYEKYLPVNTPLTAKMLERAYFDVGRDLAYFPKTKTVVFFYSEKNFREIFKMRDIVRAFYDGNIRIPLPSSQPRLSAGPAGFRSTASGTLERKKPRPSGRGASPSSVSDEEETVNYLYHEYTHAIISAKTNNNCPVWLSEGVAVYEELKWTRPGVTINIPGGIADRSDISIEALDKVFTDPGANSLKLAASYTLACTAVEYMADNWGMKGLEGLLNRIGAGLHAVNAIDDEFLMSEKEFNRRWADFVIKKYVKPRGAGVKKGG